MIKFEHVEPASGRAVAVIGDTLADVIGKPLSESAALAFNVADEPATSDIFAGLGTDGDDVPFTSLGSATFALTGFYAFSATTANGSVVRIEVVCFPAAALTVDKIKYAHVGDKNSDRPRPPQDIRGTLHALGMHATKAGVEATLEVATSAPFHGTSPVTLGASTNNSYYAFGGW